MSKYPRKLVGKCLKSFENNFVYIEKYGVALQNSNPHVIAASKVLDCALLQLSVRKQKNTYCVHKNLADAQFLKQQAISNLTTTGLAINITILPSHNVLAYMFILTNPICYAGWNHAPCGANILTGTLTCGQFLVFFSGSRVYID